MVIREEDRRALRFLWIERFPTEDEPFPHIATWQMTRVPFGTSSSPFLLAATLRHDLLALKERFPDTMASLLCSFYVDDLVVGADNEAAAHKIYTEAKTIMTNASMEFRKWASNASSLRDQFVADGVAFEIEGGDPNKMKVLGLP
ncbi:hypothetical protein HPB48_013657 [Haemaphysalis longicornis]|uniref:Reverse transcriptase domain-containing protein n=1 Tax=Haemaphysalis longicornis TaxID=44386 RepID=A0A9J6FXT8_HAELO|nr:hypothetical protein HPB48_013657 [Haemaphysalis longicornis]